MPALDVEYCRSRFPALRTDWALFDNAGGSVPAQPVIDRLVDYASTNMVQLGASYELSRRATEAVERGRRAAAALVGARADEVVLNGSTTMNVYVLANALAATWPAGAEVVVTELDHEANRGAWCRLAERGVVVREWKLRPETASLELDDLLPLLGPRTELVCFTHCSNLVGRYHDAAGIVRAVHDAGALACIDGVAYAPHRRPDVRALDADFYLLSPYKVFGPHVGLLYGKRELLERARGQYHYFIGEDDVPYKLTPGNVNHEVVASLAGVIDYLADVHEHSFGSRPDIEGDPEHAGWLGAVYDLFAAHEQQLSERLLAHLRDRPDARIIGEPRADAHLRAPTIGFTLDGRRSSEVPPLLDEQRVAVRYGDFYARRAIEALGLVECDGIVRASMLHYNTLAEVDRLIAALERV